MKWVGVHKSLPAAASGGAAGEPRLLGLDGLRAFAVVAVILYHLDLPGVLPAGFLGVDVFFTISGFIITALLLREHAREGRVDWLAFCGRRARRLLPPTLAMIAVAVPVTALVAPEAMERLRADLPAALLYVSNWWQIHSQQSYFEAFGRPPVLRHLWSLAIEEQFYVVWPLVVGLVLHRRGHRALAATCLLAAAASATWMAVLHQGLDEAGDPSRIYLGADTHVMGLFVGAALACLLDPWRPAAAPQAVARAVLHPGVGWAALGALLFAMQLWHEAASVLFRGGFLLVGAATALLIVASLQPGTWLTRGLQAPVVQWLGSRSFSLYLWHWPIVVWTWPGHGADALQATLQTLLRLVLTAAAAEVSYRLVERGTLWRRLGASGSDAEAPARPLLLRGALAAGLAACAVVLGSGAAPRDASASAGLSAADLPTMALLVLGGTAEPAPSATSRSTRPPVSPGDTRAARPSATPSAMAPTPAPGPEDTAAAAGSLANAAAAPSTAAFAVPGCVHIVGDSVVLGAGWTLRRTIARAVIDAEVGRQGHQALRLLRQKIAERELCPNVVLHIGTNGYLDEPRYLELVGLLARRGPLVLVTLRADRRWTESNNTLIARAARETAGVRLVDWAAESDAQPQYFVQDGIHLTVAGMKVFAEQIRGALHGTGPESDLAGGPPSPATLAQSAAAAPGASAPRGSEGSTTTPAAPAASVASVPAAVATGASGATATAAAAEPALPASPSTSATVAPASTLAPAQQPVHCEAPEGQQPAAESAACKPAQAGG